MEICIRPENHASLRVVEKLGFRYEGLRRRFIHIDGDWRDHYAFALVREEVPEGVLAALGGRAARRRMPRPCRRPTACTPEATRDGVTRADDAASGRLPWMPWVGRCWAGE